jgi:hypothetical protein
MALPRQDENNLKTQAFARAKTTGSADFFAKENIFHGYVDKVEQR